MARAPNSGAPRVSAHVVSKGPSSFSRRDPFEDDGESENEKTALESGWEDEASTTVAEQGDVAEKIRSIGVERGDRTPQKTGVTSTGMLDEPTVDDRRANIVTPVKPQALPAARLVITGGNDKGNVLAISAGKTYTVGRAIDNDMVLTDIAVSRKHFDLKNDGGAWVLVDRRSGNGTLVNGNLEDNAFMLANGDVIEIGNTTFRFEMPNGLPRSHPASGMETPATSSMDASIDASIDQPLVDPRGPTKRPMPAQRDDDDEEQSTVAGKPILPSQPLPPQPSPPQPPRARQATQPPPAPSSPPRTRPATKPPLPAPMSFGAPPQAMQARPPSAHVSGQPTLLGEAMGLQIGPPQQSQPLPPLHAMPSPAPAAPPPGLYNNGYPVAGSGPQPVVHPSMPQFSNYGMQMPYVQQPRAGGLPRRTKLIIGAVGLVVAAALLTIVIIQVATGGDEPSTKKTENKQPVATTAAKDKTEKAGIKPAAEPTKPTVEPIKGPTVEPIKTTTTEPAKTTVEPIKTTTTEPAKTEPAKTEPAKVEATKTTTTKTAPKVDPAQKARDEAAAAKKREEAAAKKEREAEARREREEAAAKKRAAAAAKKAEAGSNKRVGADTSGVKDKADSLYRAKNFAGAAAALKAAAKGDDATELKSLAAVYENLGKAYNVGMAPGTPPKQAFDLLVKAKNFDNRAGNAFTSEINSKLGDIASKAAVAFMADKDYVRAKNAVQIAESAGKGNASTQGVRSSLESAAGKLFKEAQAEMGSDEKAAREKLKQVQQMVDAKSQWHQKAGKLLSGG
ncbi:MAG: FHA domain-containing protein [Kofleriaceae bacterium]|nr:FHA domain-containing protein [Kofleriaceae bacterium]